MRTTKRTRVTTLIEGVIGIEDLRELVQRKVEMPPGMMPVIYVTLPRGGDYGSAAQLYLDEDVEIRFSAEWTD